MSKKLQSVRWLVILGVLLSLITVSAATALADWNPGDSYKMHFPQLPDLENGMDVASTYTVTQYPRVLLADDFLCTETGNITDIHVWGSWLDDQVSQAPMFYIIISSDIPANENPTYSMPGNALWSHYFGPGEYTAREYATGLDEDFFWPSFGLAGTDTKVYQYNFYIAEDAAFTQQQGTTYWLSVAESSQQTGLWGWKTSTDHWTDNAVYVFPDQLPGPWEPIDPTGSPLDLAFVITSGYEPTPPSPPLPAPQPGPAGVGGDVYPVNKAALLMPWLSLAAVLVLAIGGVALVLRRRRIQ